MARATRPQVPRQFFFIVGGIPAAWTWEELKDFTKQTVSHVQVNVDRHPDASPCSSHKVGYITIIGRDDAERLYGFLENSVLHGCPVLVFLFDTTHESEANLITCNSAKFGLNKLSPPEALTVYMRTMPEASPIPVAHMGGHQQFQTANPTLDGNMFCPDLHSMGQAQPTGWNGAPINTAHGYYERVSRGIHVSRLSFTTSKRHLQELFGKAGPVIDIAMSTNSTGKSRGSARVLFASLTEAQHAVELFDGTTFMERKIRVKLDRDASGPPRGQQSQVQEVPPSVNPPIVVDGSSYRGKTSGRPNENAMTS